MKGITFGAELEWGDIDTRVRLPSRLGHYNSCETDIYSINVPGQPQGYPTDPLHEDHPYGAEINVAPAKSPTELTFKISEIRKIFIEHGTPPTAPCSGDFQVHVRVPGLRDDMKSLDHLMRYIYQEQDRILKHVYVYNDPPGASPFYKQQKTQIGGAKKVPAWLVENLSKAKDFEDWLRIFCCGKDGVTRSRPWRYCINPYTLKHIDTIEFRCFYNTVEAHEVQRCAEFAHDFMFNALTGADLPLYDSANLFPVLKANIPAFEYWNANKYPKERAKKVRIKL